jgi:hypothetical protein
VFKSEPETPLNYVSNVVNIIETLYRYYRYSVAAIVATGVLQDSIKKNPNHAMMVQKEEKKGKCWTPPKEKGKEKVSDESSSSKPNTKGKYGPSPDVECFHYHKKGH